MATSYEDGDGEQLTMDDLKRMVAEGEAYDAKRAELMPKVIETVGGKEGWANGVLADLAREETAEVVGRFLLGALCGIERQEIEELIPPSQGDRDFIALCREAGCERVSLDQLSRGPVPQAYLNPSYRRCCFLFPKRGASPLAFSQYEIFARTRGLRFARPEEMLELAIAVPELRFERCYAIGAAVDDGARGDARTYVLSDHGTEEKITRYVHVHSLPTVWLCDQRILAVKID